MRYMTIRLRAPQTRLSGRCRVGCCGDGIRIVPRRRQHHHAHTLVVHIEQNTRFLGLKSLQELVVVAQLPVACLHQDVCGDDGRPADSYRNFYSNQH